MSLTSNSVSVQQGAAMLQLALVGDMTAFRQLLEDAETHPLATCAAVLQAADLIREHGNLSKSVQWLQRITLVAYYDSIEDP